MVGDRYFDIDGANGAGVESVGVTFGYGSEEELKKSGATYLAGCTDEIEDIIFCR
jgi:phosphoglycolate phosphatase